MQAQGQTKVQGPWQGQVVEEANMQIRTQALGQKQATAQVQGQGQVTGQGQALVLMQVQV